MSRASRRVTFKSIEQVTPVLNKQLEEAQQATLYILKERLLTIIENQVYGKKHRTSSGVFFFGEGLPPYKVAKVNLLTLNNGKTVYSQAHGNSELDEIETEYQPTGELLNVWKVGKVRSKKGTKKNQRISMGSIYVDNNSQITHNEDSWIHSSKANTQYSELTPSQLVYLINNGVNSNTSIFENATIPKPFFSTFIKYCDLKYSTIFNDQCVKRGIILNKNGTAQLNNNYLKRRLNDSTY